LLKAAVEELRAELKSQPRPAFTAAQGAFPGVANLTRSADQFRLDAPAKLSEETIESTIVLDSNGEAPVELAPAFETLHREFRYQLTAIGAPGPSLDIAEEVRNGRFKIAGGRPGAKVSWRLTGVGQNTNLWSGVIPERQGGLEPPALLVIDVGTANGCDPGAGALDGKRSNVHLLTDLKLKSSVINAHR
jgi:hypothetical protein